MTVFDTRSRRRVPPIPALARSRPQATRPTRSPTAHGSGRPPVGHPAQAGPRATLPDALCGAVIRASDEDNAPQALPGGSRAMTGFAHAPGDARNATAPKALTLYRAKLLSRRALSANSRARFTDG